ncbi:MAG: hypothetical protein LBI18_01300 [Planctomycetaceae bacterium]|jgi:hypothetical protein|nr:hypothetical protein [Planctomycetaceae bacterium]
MMMSPCKISVYVPVFVFGTILSVLGGELPKFEDFQPNRPILELPVVDQKIVLAHFMTGAFVRDSQFRDRFLSYEDFAPDGITANVGGESQILPIDYYFNFKKSSVEAAEFHIKTAKKLGIDGFQFFYPFPPGEVFQRNYNNIIIDFFKAAANAGVDFKFSLCLCSPPLNKNEDEKIEVFAKGFREILNAVGEDNKFWMKTPDGRFLTYLWVGDTLTDAVREAGWDFRKKADMVLPRIAYAYEKLSHKIGIDQAYIYQIRWVNDPNYIQRTLEYFPAVWNWTENMDNKQAWLDLAKLCKEKKRTFSQGVYPDYYGSKLYKKSSHDYGMYHFLKDVQKLKTDDVEHDYYYVGITDVYLDYLERVLETETPLISFITYNDYAEGHHVAPEVNHQFGFAVLFNHYKNIWQGHPEKNHKEFAVLAYKKYRHDLVPEPYNIEFRSKNNQKPFFEPESDDFIHIVTFLKQPASVFLNGHKIADAKGKGDIEVFKVPMQSGKVELRIDRKNETVIRLTGTEWITEQPFRTDRLTYCCSSECDQYYSEIFGKNAPRYFLQQYAEDESGIPFWKQGKSIGVRHSDGKTDTATIFEPDQSPEWH